MMEPSALWFMALVTIHSFEISAATASVAGFNGGFRLSWEFDADVATFTVDADFRNNTGVLLVLLSTNSTAEQGDVALMSFNGSGFPLLQDAFFDTGTFSVDSQQDWCLNSVNRSNERARFIFSRKRNVCDNKDFSLQPYANKISFGYCELKPDGLPNLERPTNFTELYLNLLNPRPSEPAMSDISSIDPIPVQISYSDVITISCSVVNLQAPNKTHIVKMEPVVTLGNEADLMIIALHGCDGDASDLPTSFDCTSSIGLQSLARCRLPIGAWSRGDDAYVFPPDVGLPIGGSAGPQWAILQKVLQKQTTDTKNDTSYVRLWKSNAPKTYEAGVIYMGLNVGAFIPRATTSFTTRISGYCPSPCLQDSSINKTAGINVISAMLSTFLSGQRITLRHYSAAQSQELSPIADDPLHVLPTTSYVKPPRNVMPDDVLQVVCDISRRNDEPPFQGSPHLIFPSCMAIVHYYPKTNLSLCTTKPSYTVDGGDDFYTLLGSSISSFNWTAGTYSGASSLNYSQAITNATERKYSSGTVIASCRGDKAVDYPWNVTGLSNNVLPFINFSGTSCSNVSAPTNCSSLTMATAPTIPPASTAGSNAGGGGNGRAVIGSRAAGGLVGFNGGYRISWDFDANVATFTVDADFRNNTGVLLALTAPNSTADQGDIVLMYFNGSGRPVLQDGFYDAGTFSFDSQQDLCLNSVNKSNERARFIFSRKRNVCDSKDFSLLPYATKISFGYCELKPDGYPDLQRPTNFTEIYVNLLNPRPSEPATSDITRIDPIPREVSYSDVTTISCSVVNLQAPNKTYIVKMEPVVTLGNEADLMIMALHGCDGDVSDLPTSFDCISAIGLQSLARCRVLIGGWSRGDDAYVFPPDVGLPIGGSAGPQWAILQKVFQKQTPDIKNDTSYVRLWKSNTPKTYEAGVIYMGLNVGAFLPRATTSFTTRISGYCPSPCLRDLTMNKTTGINVISAMLSTFLTSKRITLRHYSAAQNQELTPIADDPLHVLPTTSYVKPPRNVMPDDVLQVVCDISRQEGEPAFQGSPYSIFPSCMALVYYYPKTNLSLCTTKPSYTVDGGDDLYTMLSSSIGSFNWTAGTYSGASSLNYSQAITNATERKYSSGTVIASCRGDKAVDIPWNVTGLSNNVVPFINFSGSSCSGVSAPTNCSSLTMATAPTIPPATTLGSTVSAGATVGAGATVSASTGGGATGGSGGGAGGGASTSGGAAGGFSGFSGSYIISWDFDDNVATFTVDADFRNNTGVVLALTAPNSTRDQGDIALMYFNGSGRPILQDAFYDAGNISLDSQQDLCLNSFNKSNERARVIFSRKRNACDNQDFSLLPYATKISFGYCELKPDGLPNLNRPTNFTEIYVNLLNPRPSEPATSDITSIDPIPREMSYSGATTTISCSVVNLQVPNKTHIVKIEPVITLGNEADLLVMALHGCDGDLSDLPTSFDCTSAVGIQGLARCRPPIAGFSRGDSAYVFPPDVGLPIGGSAGPQWAILQKVFQKQTPDIKNDTSYIRLWKSNVPKTYEAGVIFMGLNVGAFLPQATTSFTTRISGYCPSPCFRDSTISKTTGINVISTMLSTFLTGKRITLRHYSAGQNQELSPIADDPLHVLPTTSYVKPPRNVMPDDVLQVVCDISRREGEPAFQGSPLSIFPSCMALVHYYPKTNLSLCTTKPSYTVDGGDDFYNLLGSSIGAFNWSAGIYNGASSLNYSQAILNATERKYSSGTVIASCRGDKVVDNPWNVTGLSNNVLPTINFSSSSCSNVSAPTNCSSLTMVTAPTIPPATTAGSGGGGTAAGGAGTGGGAGGGSGGAASGGGAAGGSGGGGASTGTSGMTGGLADSTLPTTTNSTALKNEAVSRRRPWHSWIFLNVLTAVLMLRGGSNAS